MFEARFLSFSYGRAQVLDDIHLAIEPGQLTAIAGPNGAGKSTLLNIFAGLLPRYKGECLFEGREVRSWNREAFARQVSVVPQSISVEFPFTTEQVVLMGRAPFGGRMFESEADFAAAHRAMELTDILSFRDRDVRTLSGGERQRVIVATALAQQPRALLLDEPTTFLDLQHQVLLWRLIRDQARAGILVIAVTHDLNLAAAYADRIIVLHNGRVAADGAPHAVIRPELIQRVFTVDAIIGHSHSGRPWIHYAE